MKIIEAKNIHFDNGYLLDDENEILNDERLVRQLNDFDMLCQFVNFCLDNEEQIEAAGKPIVFTPEQNATSITIEPHTPTLDAMEEEAFKAMKELKAARGCEEANDAFKHYPQLIEFVHEQRIIVDDKHLTSDRFNANPLSLTKEHLEDAMKAFSECAHLMDKVRIED